MLKKIIAALTVLTLLPTDVLAYDFPEPDWGAILKVREAMVKDPEFDLYTEAEVGTAPYYGARLEPKNGVYIGMAAQTDIENFRPLGSYMAYIDSPGQTDLYFPQSKYSREDNVITTVGWNFSTLDEVNYDNIAATLATLNGYNKPMIIRFGAEMNGNALGDDPQRFIEVFRNVANMIHQYPNFAVVWSPNDMGSLDRPFQYYYPGDEYVDWVGVSCYTFKYFMGTTDVLERNKIFFMNHQYGWATNKIKPLLEFMKEYNIQKPVMISEGGVDTSNNIDGDNSEWASARLRNMMYYLAMRYPQIKLINYFNVYRPTEVEKFNITEHEFATKIFLEARDSGAYITEAGGSARFAYQKADDGYTLRANDSIIRLHTFARILEYPEFIMNYAVDGQWYSNAGQIPYTCNLNISGMADGAHTLRVWGAGGDKSYTFYKRGSCIRFGAEPDAAVVAAAEAEAAAAAAAASKITITLNGEEIECENSFIENGKTLVPMRAIFNALGAEVEWIGETRTVRATKNGKTISLDIGSTILYVDGAKVALEVPAKIVNDRTFVPVRAISESFDCDVDWDGNTRTVLIAAAPLSSAVEDIPANEANNSTVSEPDYTYSEYDNNTNNESGYTYSDYDYDDDYDDDDYDDYYDDDDDSYNASVTFDDYDDTSYSSYLDKSSPLVINKRNTLLYSLPNGGIDFPYARSYFKKYSGDALFATFDGENNDDDTGYSWYECLMVSKYEDASLYYTSPTDWMSGYGMTEALNYNGETWYYTFGAAMHIDEADAPSKVFHLNDETGVDLYPNAKEAAIDLLNYYFENYGYEITAE